MRRESKEERTAVRPCDLVFVTNGSLMTNASFGDNEHVARLDEDTDDLGLFTVWQNLAARDAKFGHPEKFLGQIGKTKWMSCFITMKDYPEFFGRVERMMGSPAGTGGVVTLRDSGWEMSLMFYDRDCFPHQRENNEDVLKGDGLFGERLGTYIRKPMGECTGNEILLELLCHLDMLDMKDEVLAHAHVSTCMIPCITSRFMPRTAADRPRVVTEGCTNVAFIGQHVEVPGDSRSRRASGRRSRRPASSAASRRTRSRSILRSTICAMRSSASRSSLRQKARSRKTISRR